MCNEIWIVYEEDEKKNLFMWKEMLYEMLWKYDKFSALLLCTQWESHIIFELGSKGKKKIYFFYHHIMRTLLFKTRWEKMNNGKNKNILS